MNPPSELNPIEQSLWMDAYEDALSDTGDHELALLAAWGAVRKDMILRVRGGKSIDPLLIRGWAMLFTSTDKRDLDKEYFNRETRTLLEYYPRAPLWMEHGYDAVYGVDPIGYRSNANAFRRGIVLEHVLHADHPLVEQTLDGVDQGDYVYSTDTLVHYMLRGRDKTGYNGVWFAAGCSLTRSPSEPALGAVVRTGDYIKSIKRVAAEAREAQSGATSIHSSTHRRESMLELLKGLAAFFGVEETLAAVKAETDALLNQLAQPTTEEEPVKADMPDLAALAAALGLPPDADTAAITAKLSEILSMMQSPPSDGGAMGKSTRKWDYDGLAGGVKAAALNAPALGGRASAHTPDKHQAGGKSSRYTTPNYNRGAKVPGLAELVLAHVGGKSEAAIKAMGYSVGPTGGYFLREEVSTEIIEYFRAEAIVNKLGATVVDMAGIESLVFNKQLTGASARYRGEGQTDAGSNPTWGNVNLQLKELISSTNVSRRLLKNSVANLERMIRDDLQKAIAIRADLAALRGSGGIPDASSTGAEPRGVRYTTGVTVTNLATNGRNPTIKDFIDGWGRIEDENVPAADTWGIAFSPRTKRFMENLLDTTGQRIDPTLWTGGYDYAATTQISNSLTKGTSSDCTEIILGDWQYLIVGIGQDIEITIDESVDRKKGEIYIEAIMMHDVGVAQPVAFEVIEGVRATS